MSCSCLSAALRVLQLSFGLQKSHKNRKENEHVENLVFDVAAALRPCFCVRQSCCVAARNPEICRHRQVHGCRKADVKQALVLFIYVVLDDFVQNSTYDIIYA